MTKGTMGVLNVGAGDTKLTFDKNNPMERMRSARIVTDMLKRGYVLFIETGQHDGHPTYQRVLEFREDVCEYIIADLAAPIVEETEYHEQIRATPSREGIAEKPAPKLRKGGRPRKAVDAGRAVGVAVARSAGG